MQQQPNKAKKYDADAAVCCGCLTDDQEGVVLVSFGISLVISVFTVLVCFGVLEATTYNEDWGLVMALVGAVSFVVSWGALVFYYWKRPLPAVFRDIV